MRLADALFRAGIQSDAAEPAGESAFDDAVDSIYLAQAPAYDDEIEIPF